MKHSVALSQKDVFNSDNYLNRIIFVFIPVHRWIIFPPFFITHLIDHYNFSIKRHYVQYIF